jgi:hypothetical protein
VEQSRDDATGREQDDQEGERGDVAAYCGGLRVDRLAAVPGPYGDGTGSEQIAGHLCGYLD